MRNAFYIAAKAPRPGEAKTRLGRAVGNEAAVEIYRAFLRDLSVRFEDSPFEPGWYVTPPNAWPEIASLVVHGGRKPRVLFQGEGDWGERQRRLFAGAAERGEERVVLVASDSPQLDAGTVGAAFRELDRHDLVLGPVHDGGYYLIGQRTIPSHHEVLSGVAMSTDTVLEELIAKATDAGLSVGWTAATFDIDEVEDLHHIRRAIRTRHDLPATRAALETLGLLKHPDHPEHRIKQSVVRPTKEQPGCTGEAF